EKAGFKNAIYAKMAPTPKEDSTWTLEDARYSAIVYKPSDIPNASGPSTIDPRSGEILESHINWYHNVMELLQNWYFTQTAPVDLKARKMQFDDELMGQLIRFVSSHEVGHTLGLRHNFGSSSTVPVDSLRSKKWLDANGHTPSIMDYARFNYVAQPEDGIDQTGLFPRIGDYDIWAIEWAYRWYAPFKTPADEKAYLNNWVIEKLKNKRLWWGDGETNQDDPRNQTEDLGDNSMKASSYGVKNLQRIITNLVDWTKESNEDYANLQEMYQQVTSQFNRYIGHVTRNIGGIHKTPKRVEQTGAVFEFTAKSKQKEAMSWLQDQVFKTPSWLINKQISSLINTAPQTVIISLQESALNRLFSVSTLAKLSRFEAEAPTEAYTPLEMMNELRRGIFSELAARKSVDVYRRSLQKSFVEKAINLVSGSTAPTTQVGGFSISIGPGRNNDIITVAKAQLRFVQSDIKASLPLITDTATRIHLQDLNERISNAFENKK
ncbi:MAG: zinc-dependent metalloprotease, partial [Chitinophagaceae bacterium]